MGKKGIGWFNVHSVHPADQTSHEDIAYRAAQSMMPAGTAAFATIKQTVQEAVDRFVVAAYACCERYCAAPSLDQQSGWIIDHPGVNDLSARYRV
jgi:hypothetical protein